MMRIAVDGSWRVRAAVDIDVPLRVSVVWGQMRDLRRFVTRDPLHRRVRVSAPPRQAPSSGSTAPIPVGTRMVVSHRFFGVGPDRNSRLLWWREGRGFAISDLSRRGVDVGFPHACLYEVTPIGAAACRVTISARGRWTARWLPRPVVRLWLAWVLSSTATHVRRELDGYRRAVHSGTMTR